MPLKKGTDDDLVFINPINHEFVASWSDQPLTVAFVSAMMNEAYRAGFLHGEDVLAKVRNILREN